MSEEDIKYFKETFNIDFRDKSDEEIEIILDALEKKLNEELITIQKENLNLEKELLEMMNGRTGTE